MKRIFGLLIIIPVFVLAFGFNAFAEDISNDELLEIVKFGVELRYTLADRFCWYDGGFSPTELHYENGKYYAKVSGGYSYDDVINKIENMIAPNLAEEAKILFNEKTKNDNKTNYLEYNGENYYYYNATAETNRFAIDYEKINDLTILSRSNSEIIVCFDATSQRYTQDEAATSGIVYVTLCKINDIWKIADYDISNLLFSAECLLKEDELTNKAISESVKAVLFDLYGTSFPFSNDYYYTFLSGTINYNDTIESLDNKDTWVNYALKYCTSDIVNEILPFDESSALYIENGIVKMRNQKQPSRICSIRRELQNEERVKSVTYNGNVAFVTYEIQTANKDAKQILVNIEFTKTNDGWKISGGDYVEVLRQYALGNNPSTGDDTLLMGVIVCTTLIITLILKLKRELTLDI